MCKRTKCGCGGHHHEEDDADMEKPCLKDEILRILSFFGFILHVTFTVLMYLGAIVNLGFSVFYVCKGDLRTFGMCIAMGTLMYFLAFLSGTLKEISLLTRHIMLSLGGLGGSFENEMRMMNDRLNDLGVKDSKISGNAEGNVEE